MFILLLFILILLGTIIRYANSPAEKSQVNITINYNFQIGQKDDEGSKYWDGPTPSKEEQNANQNWYVDHLIKYPSSIAFVRPDLSHVADKAKAVIRYNELETMRHAGTIDEIDYQRELEKILHLIDISEDLTK